MAVCSLPIFEDNTAKHQIYAFRRGEYHQNLLTFKIHMIWFWDLENTILGVFFFRFVSRSSIKMVLLLDTQLRVFCKEI